ncbi:MAG: hypothetical protein SFU56_20085 [Capsulimonadales bacterium]|nr:hypothetical protein [Capsulimonadales bacterium]
MTQRRYLIAAIGGLLLLAGCSTPESKPSPVPSSDPNGNPTRSTDPRVKDNPNIPPEIRRQLGGGQR